MFTPAKKEKIPTLIVRQIRSAIIQGQLKPGQALPPEKELLEEFEVSKHTLREALRTLEGMGLITIKRGAGGGPLVRAIDFDTAREYFSSFLHFQKVSQMDLSEIRKLLEPYIARKAAETLTEETLTQLEDTHRECARLIEQGQSLVGAEAEILFHVVLAKHTNNFTLWVIMDFINNLLADLKKKTRLGLDFSQNVLKDHQKILEAIKARDPDAAEAAMRSHIEAMSLELNKAASAAN